MIVELDFETRSECNLTVCGADVYAQHPTTEIICLVYHAYDYEYWWYPSLGYCDVLGGLACNPDALFVAHHAAFEMAVWRHIMVARHGFPEIPLERWDCTMAACAWKAIPLPLEKGAKVLGLDTRKDMDGRRLVLAASRLDKKTGLLPELAD